MRTAKDAQSTPSPLRMPASQPEHMPQQAQPEISAEESRIDTLSKELAQVRLSKAFNELVNEGRLTAEQQEDFMGWVAEYRNPAIIDRVIETAQAHPLIIKEKQVKPVENTEAIEARVDTLSKELAQVRLSKAFNELVNEGRLTAEQQESFMGWVAEYKNPAIIDRAIEMAQTHPQIIKEKQKEVKEESAEIVEAKAKIDALSKELVESRLDGVFNELVNEGRLTAEQREDFMGWVAEYKNPAVVNKVIEMVRKLPHVVQEEVQEESIEIIEARAKIDALLKEQTKSRLNSVFNRLIREGRVTSKQREGFMSWATEYKNPAVINKVIKMAEQQPRNVTVNFLKSEQNRESLSAPELSEELNTAKRALVKGHDQMAGLHERTTSEQESFQALVKELTAANKAFDSKMIDSLNRAIKELSSQRDQTQAEMEYIEAHNHALAQLVLENQARLREINDKRLLSTTAEPSAKSNSVF